MGAKGISAGAELTDRRLARYADQDGSYYPKWTADPNGQARAELCPSFDLRGVSGRSCCVNLKKRTMVLEKKLHRDPIVLTLEDGQERVIPLRPGETALDVYQRVMNNPDGDKGQMVRRCVAVREPGGGRLLQMAKALLDPITVEPSA